MTTTEPMSHEWETCSTIADRWERVTVARVKQFVSLLGLLGSKAHRRVVKDVAEYSPDAVGLIEREIRSRGFKAAE